MENYRNLSVNMKTDGIEAQSYPDRFPQYSIPFSYHLSYFSNNTKITEKYIKKRGLEFPGIFQTVFNLTSTQSQVIDMHSLQLPMMQLPGLDERFTKQEILAVIRTMP
jgi:hypothetical protein